VRSERSSVYSLWPGKDDATPASSSRPGARDQEWQQSSWSASSSSWSSSNWGSEEKPWKSTEEKPWKSNEEKPWKSTNTGHDARAKGHGGKGGDKGARDNSEKVQRWLAYVLRRGYEELNIELKDGEWARLDELAKAVAKVKSDFGIKSSADLRSMLEQHDAAGRFEISKGWLRKVAHDRRQPQAPKNLRPVVKKEEQHSDDEDVASSGVADHRFGGKADFPPPGPGDKHSTHRQYWTTFKDRDQFWYYYEGPLGRWWCQSLDEPPERFIDDGVDDADL